MEIKTEIFVRFFKITQSCDACKGSLKLSSSQVFESPNSPNTPLFQHTCESCGEIFLLDDKFPKVIYEEIPLSISNTNTPIPPLSYSSKSDSFSKPKRRKKSE